MQRRHTDRARYFSELAYTCEKYIVPYVSRWFTDAPVHPSVLEVGCGDGGNLVPFSRRGWETVGIDISVRRITDAADFFEKENLLGKFICADIFSVDGFDGRFDLVLCHDVLEHVESKLDLLLKMERFLKPGGCIFVAFPAWWMPFGGHQQICRGTFISRLPFVHLLPSWIYRKILCLAGESDECVRELLMIKKTGVTVETFERMVHESGMGIAGRRLYFINPHYEIKFGLRPRVLNSAIAGIPGIRNFFSTSCFYLLSRSNVKDVSRHHKS